MDLLLRIMYTNFITVTNLGGYKIFVFWRYRDLNNSQSSGSNIFANKIAAMRFCKCY